MFNVRSGGKNDGRLHESVFFVCLSEHVTAAFFWRAFDRANKRHLCIGVHARPTPTLHIEHAEINKINLQITTYTAPQTALALCYI